MSDTYQAMYDVASRRIGHFDGERLISEIASRCDASWIIEIIKQEFLSAAMEHHRPSVLFKPTLSIDGNQWCALYGSDLQDGVAGFGDTPDEAMRDFDLNWNRPIPKGEQP